MKYITLFEQAPQLYHTEYPFEPSRDKPEKLDNNLGEMFQQCIFLILERLKGDKSFYKPYLDILPDAETLFSLDLTTPIGPDFPERTLMDELRAVDNELVEWAADDKARFD